MKAWHVQDKYCEMQEIVFADKRSEAICKSEVISEVGYINVRATRAKYADDLENEPSKLIQAQLENGWIFECSNCINQIAEEDKYVINGNLIYCDECIKK